ncbi:fatty acyl-CoA synthetase [Actinophytocola sp.]|uniref:fatty acyl-CoA synthetase n=1 Tax=Actinophytocola sp. TaxID=1872138 RepID=UPI00389A4324
MLLDGSEEPVDGIRASTVDGLLRRSAARTPDRVALRFGDREWTYAALDRGVSRVAGMFRRRGLHSGDRVIAHGRNSDAYLIGFLACSRAGLVHTPVNTALTAEELRYVVDLSGAAAALVDVTAAESVPTPQTIPLRETEDCVLDAAREGAVPDIVPDAADSDLVQLMFTSGTTGRPKAARLTHRSLMHQYVSAIHALRLEPDDHPLHAMPIYHVAQLHTFLVPYLAIGATNELVESPVVDDLLDRAERDRIGSMFLAPTVWVRLANHPGLAARELSSLRKAYYGASTMPGPVLERLRRQLPTLGFFNCLGQSEAGPLTSALPPEEHVRRPESAGRPVLFVELRVVDRSGRDAPVDEVGELVYRSPQLCDGYWNAPEATAEAFRDGWFHSGDLARLDAEGYVFIVDRIKDVINTGGVLVASREVEDVLYTHPAVAEAAVVGTPDPQWIEAITAVVVPRFQVAERELLDYARERLAGFKVPKRVRFTDHLPRNGAGKLLKRVLRDQLASSSE